jgi:hypothetical protein
MVVRPWCDPLRLPSELRREDVGTGQRFALTAAGSWSLHDGPGFVETSPTMERSEEIRRVVERWLSAESVGDRDAALTRGCRGASTREGKRPTLSQSPAAMRGSQQDYTQFGDREVQIGASDPLKEKPGKSFGGGLNGREASGWPKGV